MTIRMSMAVGVLVLVGGSLPAKAASCLGTNPICTGYFGKTCIAATSDQVRSGSVWVYGNNTYVYDQGAEVVCPVVKRTSASGVTLDDLYGAAMDFTAPQSNSLTCNLNIYTASTGLLLQTYPGTVSGSGGSYMMTFQPSAGQTARSTFWKSSTDWLYAQIRCTANVGNGIDPWHPAMISYLNVSERGNDSGKRIYPASWCRWATDGLVDPIGSYVILDAGNSDKGVVEGAERGDDDHDSWFEWDCHATDSNKVVDFFMGKNGAGTIYVDGYNGGGINIPQGSNFPLNFHSTQFNAFDDGFFVASLARGDSFFSSFRTY